MSRTRSSGPAPAVVAVGRGDLDASLVLIFPLLLAYALGVLVVGRTNGADVITRVVYGAVGRTAYLLVYAAAASIYLLWVRRSGRAATLRFDIVAPVVLEAAIYAFTLGTAITLLLNKLLGMGLDVRTVTGALGAGVHEELVFRLLVMGGLVTAFRDAGKSAVAIALVLSSLLFAGAHHIGPYGEPFTAHAFAFRLLAGAAFGTIFWFRSLAHAVYAHVLYDLVVAATY